MLSYETQIIQTLRKFGTTELKNPDAKHNVGSHLGEYFLWRTIKKFAEGMEERAYEKMVDQKMFTVPDAPGTYELITSPHFKLNAIVTQPIKRFSVDTLAANLKNGKYAVPEPYTKEQAEAAKIPSTSTVRKEVKEVA